MPVVGETARVEHKRIVGVGDLRRRTTLTDGHEPRLARGEGLAIEEAGPRMIGRGAGPLDAPRLEPWVREPADGRPESGHLVEDLRGVREVEALHGPLQPPCDALGQLAGDPPVGLGLTGRIDGAADSLHAALGVGEDRKSTRLNSSHLGMSYAV